jgi:hypothetical protein
MTVSSRRLSLIAVVFVAVGAFPTQVAGATHETFPGEATDASGIAVLAHWTGPNPYQFRAKNERQAVAFAKAYDLALENPNDMAYPRLDTSSNTITLPTLTGRGRLIAQDAASVLSAENVTSKVESSSTSIAELNSIADAVTRLRAKGVPHAELVWQTAPDQLHNRIIITVRELNEELMSSLASAFGTDLIAVSVDSGASNASAAYDRMHDVSSFWGGANWWSGVGQCTTGFGWNTGTGDGMITAAHCVYSGGTVTNSSYKPNPIGSVNANSEENWDPNNGTMHYSGQSVNRGDVALIRVKSGYHTSPNIYTGGNSDHVNRVVGQMNSRRVQLGDAVCSSGYVTNYWCGMVTATGVNVLYLTSGPNVWARSVVDASALGNTCPTHGDSGGPVYQWRSDGKAIAQGILSGSIPYAVACDIFFTDIWDAYFGLPGSLKVA